MRRSLRASDPGSEPWNSRARYSWHGTRLPAALPPLIPSARSLSTCDGGSPRHPSGSRSGSWWRSPCPWERSRSPAGASVDRRRRHVWIRRNRTPPGRSGPTSRRRRPSRAMARRRDPRHRRARQVAATIAAAVRAAGPVVVTTAGRRAAAGTVVAMTPGAAAQATITGATTGATTEPRERRTSRP